jgi:hypothetical protein
MGLNRCRFLGAERGSVLLKAVNRPFPKQIYRETDDRFSSLIGGLALKLSGFNQPIDVRFPICSKKKRCEPLKSE